MRFGQKVYHRECTVENFGKGAKIMAGTTDYIVKVKTSDRVAAGTDANVFVQLTGEEGVSQTLELKKSNKPNKFERNQLDEFKFLNVRVIGALKSLKVWHDNKGNIFSKYLQVALFRKSARISKKVCNSLLTP